MLKKQFPSIIFDEKLSKYSTFQIGGTADYFYKLKNTADLIPLLNFAKKNKIPYYMLGGGSNILFDDSGFRGLIIKIENKNIELKSSAKDSFLLTADAGVSIATLLNFSLKNNLSGLEKWAGLPGTVGGAVRGNAGCNGLETSEILISATLLNPKTGKIRTVKNKYFEYKYRHSKLKKTKEIVLSAIFKLQKSKISATEQKEIIQLLHKARISKQPFGASTGSFFQNPNPKNPAGFLIEKAGLKGKIFGKAQISAKHANFLLNLGGATSKDILGLARLARKIVKAKFGLTLKEEVQVLSAKGLSKL